DRSIPNARGGYWTERAAERRGTGPYVGRFPRPYVDRGQEVLRQRGCRPAGREVQRRSPPLRSWPVAPSGWHGWPGRASSTITTLVVRDPLGSPPPSGA